MRLNRDDHVLVLVAIEEKIESMNVHLTESVTYAAKEFWSLKLAEYIALQQKILGR